MSVIHCLQNSSINKKHTCIIKTHLALKIRVRQKVVVLMKTPPIQKIDVHTLEIIEKPGCLIEKLILKKPFWKFEIKQY